MVKINQVNQKNEKRGLLNRRRKVLIFPIALCFVVVMVFVPKLDTSVNNNSIMSKNIRNEGTLKQQSAASKSKNDNIHTDGGGGTHNINPEEAAEVCPVSSINQLPDSVLNPTQDSRYIVTPPQGGKVYLICCTTTKGNLSLLLHENWAPIGVERFISMVKYGYFSSKVPLTRCLKNDACQFGLAGLPEYTKQFSKRLDDDPPWLPMGKENQKNKDGVIRYPKGFFTYAGSGKNSRTNQFVLTAFSANKHMGGGSPWEVPLGELVGNQSFVTSSNFNPEYGEHGPSQKIVRNEGNSERVQKEWPNLDYWTGCSVIDEKELS